MKITQESMHKIMKERVSKGKETRIFPICLLLCLLLLSGCQGIILDSNETQTNAPPPNPTATAPIDTQVSLNLTTLTPTEEPQLTPSPTIPLATPEFSITQNSDESPVPWRPPVYPVPWIPSPQDHFYFASPISAYDIDSAYSIYPYGGVFFENVVHTGIDIPGDIGIPILAAGSGTVIYAGQGVYRQGNNVYDDPYGKAVVIEHDFSYQGEPLFTLYAHLDEILVEKGQFLDMGDQIGLLGRTGKTTGPHLHFEVRLGSNEFFATRNPDLWISPPQGWGVLVGQIHTYVGFPLEQQIVYLYPTEDNPAIGPVNDVGWISTSYQNDAINSDPHYKENFTLANLPAGKYYIYIPVTSIGLSWSKEIEIKPGQVTFFRFNLWKGFTDIIPPTPTYIFTPSP
jgi:murein DD-endopeptidase MepM/ murein hydrolase activator NlpD